MIFVGWCYFFSVKLSPSFTFSIFCIFIFHSLDWYECAWWIVRMKCTCIYVRARQSNRLLYRSPLGAKCGARTISSSTRFNTIAIMQCYRMFVSFFFFWADIDSFSYVSTAALLLFYCCRLPTKFMFALNQE